MKNKLLLIALFICAITSISAQTSTSPFEVEINYTHTFHPFTSEKLAFKLPIIASATDYDFYIDWNNDGNAKRYTKESGIVTNGNTERIGTFGDYFEINYDTEALKRIKIYGPDFPGFNYKATNSNQKSNVRRVITWGDVVWQTMENAFYQCTNLVIDSSAGIPNLLGTVSMKNMFKGTTMTAIPYLNTWDVSNITNMHGMFSETKNFNQDISDWNVSAVTNMDKMFYKAEAFNNEGQALDWGNNTANVISMEEMFSAGDTVNGEPVVSVFNQDISSWDVANVTSMQAMFYNAYSFNNNNQPLTWNTGNVTDMRLMFAHATSFDQNLGNWNISNIGKDMPLGAGGRPQSMDGMFDGIKMSTANYDATLTGWKDFVALEGKPHNVTLSAGYNLFCDTGKRARDYLNIEAGWFISNEGTKAKDSYSICDPDKFVMLWGVYAGNTITIPTDDSKTYDYTIDWGDETSDQNVSGSISHTYTKTGYYTVKISGTFPRIDFSKDIHSSYRRKLVEILHWGTIQWESMENAFYQCNNLTIDSNANAPDLSRVTSTSNMFYYCYSLDHRGNIGSWDVSNITNMNGMFRLAQKFNQDLSTWNVSKVTTMNAMFSQTGRFNNGNTALTWGNGTRNVVNFTQLFHGSAFNQPINDWDVSGAKYMTDMFAESSFNKPLNNWNVSNVTHMNSMFIRARHFNQNLSDWAVANVTTMHSMFKEAEQYNNGGVPLDWGTATENITNVEAMFAGTIAFNQPILWQIPKVTTTKDMFLHATKFNQNISNWAFRDLKDMTAMFSNTKKFNNGGNPMLLGESTKNVVNIVNMFNLATSFNQPITWNIEKVTSLASLFSGATAFNQDISDWNITSVNSATSVFLNASNFNNGGVPLDWGNKTRNITNFSNMFKGATSFNQPINDWNVSSAHYMSSMFNNATSFDQALDNWNVSNVTDFYHVFNNVSLSLSNYDGIITAWSEKMKTVTNEAFHGGNSTYCNQAARDLISSKGWTVSDNGLATDCSSLSTNIEAIKTIAVYPNPAYDIITISFGRHLNNASIKLYNIHGSLVKSFNTISADNFSFSTNDLANGIYIIHINNNSNVLTTKKIIVEN